MGKLINKDDFKRGKYGIGVWGTGFIGGTTAMAFASEGVNVTCYDIDENTVKGINMGKIAVTNLEFWYGATMTEFVEKNLITATTTPKDMGDENIKVHFICVPTEKDGKPWDEPLLDVINKLKKINPPLVIIESTLTPGTLDRLPLGQLRAGMATRRDWFHSPEKNMKNLPRVYAGMTKEISDDMHEILSLVVDNLIEASNHRIAEIVKSVENSLLHIPAVYSTQLAHAYPDLDVGEVLKLASTHWRIPLYYPSLGTGGYCIPLSSQYVRMGATHPEYLTILDATIKSDTNEPLFTARTIENVVKKGTVGIMGVSYKGDLKVHILSPAIPIIDHLRSNPDLKVLVNDPYYSPEEINHYFKCESFDFNKELNRLDAIVMVTDHKVYKRFPLKNLLKDLKPGVIIIDNYGNWKSYRKFFKERCIQYFKVGDAGWTLEDLIACRNKPKTKKLNP